MLELVIGNKNYSSWSMRAWLALEATGAPYRETVIPLDRPDTAARIGAVSPAGRVPALRDGELVVWDSLAICEYLAEQFPQAGLWPAPTRLRALGRSAAAEMHSGFQAIRTACPMNLRRSKPLAAPSPEVLADVARLRALWRSLLDQGAPGGFLLGRFGIADAFFAPVVGRFRSYGLPLDGAEATWAEALWRHPAVATWVAGAAAEREGIAKYEAD